MQLKRLAISAALIGAGFLAGIFASTRTTELVLNYRDGVLVGGTVTNEFVGSFVPADEIATAACRTQTDLLNFDITHAILTTSKYQFDCVEPGKDAS
ncbi:hypothetical protein [Ruegeria profundi]|uniref:Uncharacterized protein n=1 Tax=Ruegeria profundi TaxID=1685378 RepID=A0A0X3TTR8_9RHOB|nr:hypothetical protein [Ruegeria profundi]KUJ79109.1 hypothetical protein AVO44_12095 [Ruegeria profundi]